MKKALETNSSCNSQQNRLCHKQDQKQRRKPLIPFLQGNSTQATDDNDICRRPENIGKSVAKLECKNCCLSAHTNNICQLCHDWHGCRSLTCCRRNEEVDQRLYYEHYLCRNCMRRIFQHSMEILSTFLELVA